MIKYATPNQRYALNKLNVGFNCFVTQEEASVLLRLGIWRHQVHSHAHQKGDALYCIPGGNCYHNPLLSIKLGVNL